MFSRNRLHCCWLDGPAPVTSIAIQRFAIGTF
jgi:hypothetical protein